MITTKNNLFRFIYSYLLIRSMWIIFAFFVFNSCSSPVGKANAVIQLDSTSVGQSALIKEIRPIHAPFSFKTFTPVKRNHLFNIKDSGAKENLISTNIIQDCINKASKQGGGTVIIPKGKWKSGRLTLKNNVNLHLEKDAVLSFSGDLMDYQPAVFTRIEGIEVMSLGACIYANAQHDISITGNGKLIGPAQGEVRHYIYDTTVIEKVVPLNKPVKERKYCGTNGEGYFLPMFISPINCKNVLIEGITLVNTAFWNIVPTYCNNVIIRGVKVNSVGIPRGDGIDIESSKNVLIEFCTLSCGDDCFTLKAGRGEDGIRVNKPTENVVIRYCMAKEGHGGITVGSETAGVIKNVYVHDCFLDNTGVGLRFKTRRPRGGGGQNLTYERIKMKLRYTAFKWDMLGSPGSVGELAYRYPKRKVNNLTPKFENITFKDIEIEKCSRLLGIIGIPESPVNNVTISNLNAQCDKLIECNDLTNLSLNHSHIYSNNDTIYLSNAENCIFNNVSFYTNNTKISFQGDSLSLKSLKYKNSTPKRLN